MAYRSKHTEWRYAGTEDLVGAKVIECGYNEFILTKGKDTFKLEVEEEWPMTCFCDECCSCRPDFNLRAFRKAD